MNGRSLGEVETNITIEKMMNVIIGKNLIVNIEPHLEWALGAVSDVSVGNEGNEPNRQLRVESLTKIDLAGLRELEQGVYIGRNVLVDSKYGVQLTVSEDGTIVLASDRSAVEWLMWLLHVAAIRSGSVFVHGAAVEFGGQAVLFPSWGGVGKTALVSGFIQEYGWNLLGDDLVILEEDGTCHPFPKPMVLYPYHRSVFPEVFASGKGPVAPTFMNHWLTSVAIAIKPLLRQVPGLLAFARKHNPQSTRVPPADVFGPAKISDGGKVHATIWLERLAGIDAPQLVPADDTLASRIIGSTTNEYDPHCVRLTNVAMGLGMLHLDEYWSGWRRIIDGALTGMPQYVLNLPASMPVADVPAAARDALVALGLWQ